MGGAKMKKNKTERQKFSDKTKLTRKEAIKKLCFRGLSVSTMLILLNDPAKGEDDPTSPGVPPEWP